MSARKRAVVVGGSLGGLFAALALRARGWDAQVYERSPVALSGRGAGVVTHPELFAALAAVGVDSETRVGVPVRRRVCFAADGAIAHERAYPQIVASWDQLYRVLRGVLPDAAYHLDAALADIAIDAETTTAVFADGRTADGALLVGADGLRSTLRGLTAPAAQPVYAGYVAWRGLVDEARLSPDSRAALMDSFAFALPPGEQMLGYPVPGPAGEDAPGGRRFNFVWYRPAPDAIRDDMLTDAEGRLHAGGISPLAVRPDVIAAMRADAEALLPPVFQDVVAATDAPFF